jgi:hypothetical protein
MINGSSPDRRTGSWRALRWLTVFLVALVLPLLAQAQTTLIGPANGGNFDLGSTFAANGWSVDNASQGPWEVGTLYSASTPFSGNSAYISLDGGATSSYNPTQPATSYFWRDVTVPAGEGVIVLSFNWFQVGEGSFDIWQVWVAPTSVTPTAVNAFPGSGQFGPVPPGIAGAVNVSGGSNVGCNTNNTLTVSLPASLAGTTFRLIFSWKSDTSVGGACPAAIDNISLTSSAPSLFTAAVPGGLWNSPESWVGGVVPANGNDVLIPAGSTLVVNQSISYGEITIAGKVQWGTTSFPLTATNLTVTSTGALFAHTTAQAGQTLNIAGNFTNDGFCNLAAGGTLVNFNGLGGTQNFTGTGQFVADKSGRGMVQGLFFQSLANCSITTTQDLVSWNFAHTAGSLNTNGKLSLDMHAVSNGTAFNRQVSTIIVTNMGSGYTSAPTVTIAPPPSGTPATAVADWDPGSQTVRSITITNPGSGYRTNPTVTIGGGGGAGAVATAIVPASYVHGTLATTAAQTQKSANASISGGININSGQGLAVVVTNGGTGYTSAPSVGVSLPVGFLNLVTNGGSGYTSAPTVTITGATGTGAVATAVVTRGQVTSINITAGGSNYTPPITVTLSGGGGSGATAAFPSAWLPQFQAVIEPTLGMVTSVNTINAGFGYTSASTPTVTLSGGGGTGALVSPRMGVYNLIYGFFIPAGANGVHTESAVVPANRRIQNLSLNANTVGFGCSFTDNITLYGSGPLVTFNSPINMGGNTLAFDHPSYGGTVGTTTAFVENGSISFRLFGSATSVARNFPFNANAGGSNYQVNTGNVSPGTVATDGCTVTLLKATQTAAPTGAGAIGTRGLRLETNGGLFGNARTVRMAWNAIDALPADLLQNTLFIGQSASLSGPWTSRSVASGGGVVPATGTRTTATTAPGPLVDNEEYFAWITTTPICDAEPTAGTITGDATRCDGGTSTLTLTGSTTGQLGITRQWRYGTTPGGPYTVSLGTGITQSTAGLPLGDYYFVVDVECTLCSPTPCPVAQTPEFLFRVVAIPTATASNDGPACISGQVQLTGTSDIGDVFSWSGPGGFSSTAQNPVLNPVTLATAGNYTFIATKDGCPSAPATTNVALASSLNISSVTAVPNPSCNGSTQLSVNAGYGGATSYCFPGLASGCSDNDYLANVTFAGIDRTSTCDNVSGTGVNFFTTPQATVVAGQSYPVSITITPNWSQGVRVWIDFNQNNEFEVDELVFTGPVSPGGTVFTGNIAIPATALNGQTRVRFYCNFATVPTGPCLAASTFGEVEDYIVNISGGVDLGNLTYLWTPGASLDDDEIADPVASGLTGTTNFTVAVSDGVCTVNGNVSVQVGAQVSASVVDNCAGQTFTIPVVVNNLGSASGVDVTYTVNYGSPVTVSGVVTGTVLGPFSVVDIVEVSTSDNIGCTQDLGSFFSSCAIVLNCASSTPISIVHCYGNNDQRTFSFLNPTPGGTVDVKWLPPAPVDAGDGVSFFDGAPGVNQISVPPFGGDLSNIGTYTSPGDLFSISIDSDASISCADGGVGGAWTIQARCTGCIEPVADVNTSVDCGTQTFNVQVDLFYLGFSAVTEEDCTVAGITYTVDGGTPVVFGTGLVEDTYDLGNFPLGSVVVVTLVHQDDATCNAQLAPATVGYAACPNDIPCDALLLPMNADWGCVLTVPGNMTTATLAPGIATNCTAPVRDLWYRFVATHPTHRVGLAGNTTGLTHTLYQGACDGPPTKVGTNCTAGATVQEYTGLTVGVTYLVRVSRTTVGSNLFAVCVSAPPAIDMGATTLVTPPAGVCYGPNETVTVRITNLALFQSIDLSVNPVTVNVTATGGYASSAVANSGVLAPGATLDVVMPATIDMSVAQTYTFNASTSVTGDGNAANDAMAPANRITTPNVALPATCNFDGPPAFNGTNLATAHPGWREAVGQVIPTGTTSLWTSSNAAQTAAFGSVTARLNLFVATRNEWIISPKFIAGPGTVLSYAIAITDFASANPDPLGMVNTDDRVEVRISTDCGASYQTLFTHNASNVVGIGPSLVPQSIDLSVYAGQEVIIAFWATDGPIDDVADYDFHIDNINIQNLPLCSGTPTAGTASLANTAPACAPAPANSLNLNGFSSGVGGIQLQWQEASAAGGPYTNITGAITASYVIPAGLPSSRWYRCIVTCANSGQSATSNEVSYTVNPTPTASASWTGNCFGDNLQFTGTTNIGTSFTWSGPGGFSSSLQNPVRPNAVPSMSGTYSFVATLGNCSSAPATVVVKIEAPVTITVSPDPASTCDPGAPVALTASGADVLDQGTANLPGVQTTNAGTGMALARGWGNIRRQFLYRADQLQAAGVTGNIVSMTFFVSSTVLGVDHNLNNYRIRMANTAQTDLSAEYAGPFTNVFGPQQHIIVWASGGNDGVNTFNFSTPFAWDGVSNVVVEICHENNPNFQSCTSPVCWGNNPTIRAVNQTYTSNRFNFSDTNPQCNVAMGSTSQVLPFTRFGYLLDVPAQGYVWSPPTGLSSTTGASVTASPLVSTTYTVVGTTGAGCSASASVTVNVGEPLAGVLSPAAPAYCAGGDVQLSIALSGGGLPYTIAWTNPNNAPAGNGTSVVANIPGLWSVNVQDACGNNETYSVTVVQNGIPTASISTGPACVGNDVLLDLTTDLGTSFSWSGPGGFSSTVQSPLLTSVTAANAGLYTVQVTSAAGCQNTASVQVTPIPQPAPPNTVGNFAICVNGTVPNGQGLTATFPPPATQASATYNLGDIPTPADAFSPACNGPATPLTVTIPPGSTVTGVNVSYQFLAQAGAWTNEQRSRVRCQQTGIAESGPVAGFFDCTGATGPCGSTGGTMAYNRNGLTIANGITATGVLTFELQAWRTWPGGDGCNLVYNIIPSGTWSVTVNYIPPAASIVWYDVPSGGTQVGSGSPFDPVAANVVDNTVGGLYPLYAAVSVGGCVSGRLPAYFAVGDEGVTLEFATGSNPSDATWQIVDAATNATLVNGQGFVMPPDATFQFGYCLPNDRTYRLSVTDAGDGVDGYQLRYTANQKRKIDNTNNLGTGTSEITGNAYSFSLPMGTNEPIYTSCDKFFWRTGEYLVADEDLDVSAIWIPNGANSVQSANTGYEFWFFNPNGGYSFRRFRSHNQSDGFGNVGATRACHMRVNNWAVAQHIPEFNLHNVRIRARVNGVNKAWGPACRFVRNEALAQCPPTKLMDIPGNQFLSCNQFRQFVSTQRVHARPVSGANRYQWRFRIPAENVEIVRTSTTYFLNLGWGPLVADPLQNGKTYEVDVRASRDGGITWCGLGGDPWGDVCLLTIGTPPAQGGSENLAMIDDGVLALWPNPNKGEELWISLNELPTGVETVAVDIHDLFGKRVSGQVLATQGEQLYTVMPLRADLAGGVYMVTVTAGDQQYVRRLVVQP